jgi:hypothetical protein
MKVMVLVLATEDSEAGKMPTEELLTQMMKFNEELVAAGIMQAGDGLQPTSKGARVHFDGKDRRVERGPFKLDDSLLAGYWLWEVKSLDEAIAWVKRCPNPMFGPSKIEIRPLYEMEDFGEIATPAVLEQQAKLRSEIEKRAKK